MRRCAIHLFNIGCLAIILIGVPAAASVRFGPLQIISRSAAELATLAALAAVVLLDGVGCFTLAAKPKEKALCRNWALSAAALFVFHWALFEGFFHFDWLRQGFLWLRSFF